MKLSEALDPVYGDPIKEDALKGADEWTYFVAFVKGYAEGAGLRLACSTNGNEMRVHDLLNDTRSPAVKRTGKYAPLALRVVVLRRLRVIETWEPESGRWGADPYDLGLIPARGSDGQYE